ncbi:MAG TPA: hypothetical protein VHO67_18010 [Polyangia bacterium]|nr:hypothetical protein [Polyangia bacterium]
MSRFPMRWSPLAAVAGLLLAAGALTGCPGSLDPDLMGQPPSTGTGGSTPGTGGSMGTGGGSGVDCSGDNDGAMIVANQCIACHSTAAASSLGGGLDLTNDSNLKSRLVGVKSPSTPMGMSVCNTNGTPYLNAGSNPATGLLIDKVTKSTPPCGLQMPWMLQPLSSTQQQCLTKWATTLTSGTQ